MRKPPFAYAKTKAQIIPAANQRLCFLYIGSTIPLLPKPQTTFCGCTVLFVLELVGNQKDRLSHDAADVMSLCKKTNCVIAVET